MSSEGRSARQMAAGSTPGDHRGWPRKDRPDKKQDQKNNLLRKLPGTLTDEGLTMAINELPVGARLAADTVYKCWREGKFADDEFISFLQSISTYSPALLHMVCGPARRVEGNRKQHAPAAQHSGKTGGKAHFAGVVSGSENAMPAVSIEPAISAESEAAMGINKEWRGRRRREALRRQTAGLQGSEHEKRVGYLCRTFMYLRQQLPIRALPALLDAIVGFTCRNRSPEIFGQQLQELVDAYQMIVPLDYIPQRAYIDSNAGAGESSTKRGTAGLFAESKGSARGGKKSKHELASVPAVSLDDNDLSRLMMDAGAQGVDLSLQQQRQRHQHAGEMCPACNQGSDEDARMVRCRSCRQVYHHVCVMHNPLLTRADEFECGSESCSSFGRAGRPPRYRLEDLADTPLGHYMTARCRTAVKTPRDLIIKVVSDKDLFRQLPDESSTKEGGGPCARRGAGGGSRGYVLCGYRSKCILGFRRFASTGSEVVFFGMYVHEYGAQSAGPHARRAFVECLDSTPLYSDERPSERQDLLTSMMLSYFEFLAATGFEHVHIRVPPPTDDKAYIFASRSVNIRLRASMHLATWVKRLLRVAKEQGVIDDFEASPHSSMTNFPASLLEPSQLASDIAFRCATGDSGGCFGGGGKDADGGAEATKAASLKDRFFVIRIARNYGSRQGLDPETVQKWTQHAMLPSSIVGERMALVSLLQREELRFHTLAHNNYSTMMLVHHLMEEQLVFGNERRQQQSAVQEASGAGRFAHLNHHGHDHHPSAAHPYYSMQPHRMDLYSAMIGSTARRAHSLHAGYTNSWSDELMSHNMSRLHRGGLRESHFGMHMDRGSRSGPHGGVGAWYPSMPMPSPMSHELNHQNFAEQEHCAAPGAASAAASGSGEKGGSRIQDLGQREFAAMSGSVGMGRKGETEAQVGSALKGRQGKAGGKVAGGRNNPREAKQNWTGSETSSEHLHGMSESTSNHSGSASTPEHTESDDMLESMGGPDEPSMPMLVEQGEEVLNNLLGQGMDGCSGTFLEQYAGSAPSLEDVRHAQAQVSLSSEEQNAWTSQDQAADWASLYAPM